MNWGEREEKPVEYHHVFNCGCTVISKDKLVTCPDHIWATHVDRTEWEIG